MEGRGKSPAWRLRGERWGEPQWARAWEGSVHVQCSHPCPHWAVPSTPAIWGVLMWRGQMCTDSQTPQVRHSQRGQALPEPLLITPWVSAHPTPAPLWISYCGSLSAWAAAGTRTPKDTQSPRSGGPVICTMSTSCDCLPRTRKHLRGRGCSWKEEWEGEKIGRAHV